MPNYTELVLARVLIDIQKYQMNKSVHLSDSEHDLLNQLKARIRAFEHIQRGWLRSSGILADYWKSKEVEKNGSINEKDKQRFQNISQKDLIIEAIATTLKEASYAKETAQQIILDIENVNGPYYQIARTHNILFSDIKNCVIAVKQAAEKINSDLRNYKINQLLPKSVYRFAFRLGARFIPSRQGLDPIRGKFSQDIDFEGNCCGHVMSWRDEIALSGKYLSLPRCDEKTYHYQKNQLPPDCYEDRNCVNQMDLWRIIDRFLNVDDSSIYELSYDIKKKERSHSMGFRKLSTGEFEFFDSNFGLFVFPDKEKFLSWLVELLALVYLRNENNYKLTLRYIGEQKDNSAGSIPLDEPPIIDTINLKRSGELGNNYFKIKRSAVLASTHSHLADHIRDQQKNLINAIEKDLYTKIHQLKDNTLTQDTPYLQPNADNYAGFNRLLKEQAIRAINLEIGRLRGSKGENYQMRIQALKKLRAQVNEANSSLTLTTIVTHWLSDKLNENSEHTIRYYIQPTSSYHFISALVENYEINPACIKVLQAEVLDKSIKILKLYRDNNNLPTTFKDLLVSLTNNDKDNVHHMINRIKNRCSENFTGFFVRTLKGREEEVDLFYQIMKNIDSINHCSLLEVSQKLDDLLKKIEMKFQWKQAAYIKNAS